MRDFLLMKNIYVVLVLLLAVWACSDKEKEEKDSLMKQVMEAHDEVMPKMGDLRRLGKDLRDKADSLSALNDTSYTEQIQQLRAASEQIEDANESMMEWMRQFEVPDNEAPVKEVLVYLREQKQKIDQVREEMLRSLEEGEQLK